MAKSTDAMDRKSCIEWRLYHDMLVTRIFEKALIAWEHERKIAAQTFPSKGQEAIASAAAWHWKMATTSFHRFARGAQWLRCKSTNKLRVEAK